VLHKATRQHADFLSEFTNKAASFEPVFCHTGASIFHKGLQPRQEPQTGVLEFAGILPDLAGKKPQSAHNWLAPFSVFPDNTHADNQTSTPRDGEAFEGMFPDHGCHFVSTGVEAVFQVQAVQLFAYKAGKVIPFAFSAQNTAWCREYAKAAEWGFLGLIVERGNFDRLISRLVIMGFHDFSFMVFLFSFIYGSSRPDKGCFPYPPGDN
jgi:hypothetical protein